MDNGNEFDSYETVNAGNAVEREINTYDSPIDPLTLTEPQNASSEKKRSVIAGIYKLVATTIVIMTVIFSASELIDLLVSDMDTSNPLFRRIFGSSAAGSSGDLFELIIGQSFYYTPTQGSSDAPASPPSSESTPSSSQTAPPPTQAQPETPNASPPPTTSPELPENAHPIITMNMSLLSYGEGFIYNNTSLSPDVSALISSPLKKVSTDSGPLVLVIHTHGTEAYMPEGATYYVDEGELARSENTEENMISVGAEFVRILEQNRISTVHCTVMHDKESYRESYSRSAETVKWYLEQYPSIRYVFDIHRDSLMKSTEELISAVTLIEGERYAQIMPVVGSGYTGYKDNLIFALRLRGMLNGEYGAISRPICLRESHYNQGLAPVSILLEIGTSGNTLNEAKKAAALTAEAVAELIREQTK